MITYQEVLAAVDFSEHMDAVMQGALRQAECSGARLGCCMWSTTCGRSMMAYHPAQ